MKSELAGLTLTREDLREKVGGGVKNLMAASGSGMSAVKSVLCREKCVVNAGGYVPENLEMPDA
jgi:hypothetical protein